MSYNAKVYRKQGGAELVVASSGKVTVESGGELDVESGGALKIAGTQITPTAAQFNYLAGITAGTVLASKAVVAGANRNIDRLTVADGGLRLGSSDGTAVTATAAEINVLGGVTAGTAAASKVAVLGANRNLDRLTLAQDGLRIGSSDGTAVTATAAELNRNASVAAGTASASKTLVLGANRNVDRITVADGGLRLGSSDGTAVTADADEINVLDGVVAGTASASKSVVLGANRNLDILTLPVSGLRIGTSSGTPVDATAAELNAVNGVTAGTATASKAAILGANRNLDVLTLPVSGLRIGTSSGTAVTADADEINVLDGVTAGTATASKAAVLGANRNLDILTLPVSGLRIGTSSGTAVTADADELNILDGATVTYQHLNALDDVPVSVTFVVGAESTNVVNVSATLRDAAGATVAGRKQVVCWLSSDSANVVSAGKEPTGTVTVITGSITPLAADSTTHKSLFHGVTSTAGVLSLDVTDTGTKSLQFIVGLPLGNVSASTDMVWST